MGELIGVVSSAIAIGGVLYLLNQAWGYGSAELPAPQAMIMKTVVEGVMDGNLPWNMILAGAAIAVVIEILGIPVMPVAVGLYLPLRTTAAIMVGGLIRHWYEKRKYAKEEDKKEAIDRGVDIVLYGHTHRPVIDIDDDIIAVNPGSLSYPRQEGRQPSYAIMEIDRRGKVHFTIAYLRQ